MGGAGSVLLGTRSLPGSARGTDQELRTARSTGVTYWEGAVAGGGRTAGSSLKVEGFAELTGYAGGLGGRF